MKLFYAAASPYSAKVRMGAVVAGVKLEEITTNTAAEPADLIAANPLGKIPSLLTDDGKSIFDSRAIMQFLDRNGNQKLYPRNAVKRTDAEVLEALCDGICDSLVAVIYERRYRPEEMNYQPWVDLQWSKVIRGLDYLETRIPRIGKVPNSAHLAIAAMTGYLNLRFNGKWERGRPKLNGYTKKFTKAYPDLAKLLPSA